MASLLYKGRGRMGRQSTARHRTLCARRGHQPGVKQWFEKVPDKAWERHVEKWCPRCQRPVEIQPMAMRAPLAPPDIHIWGQGVELGDYLPQTLTRGSRDA